VRLQFVEVRGPGDFDKAFSDMTRARADALTVLSTTMFVTERRHLADLAAKNRLPAVYPAREFVRCRGPMAYGANLADLFRRAATYVDKISKAPSPPTCPSSSRRVQTGSSIQDRKGPGLTIPQSVLWRAMR